MAVAATMSAAVAGVVQPAAGPVAAGAPQVNHIYAGEASDGPRRGSDEACAKYEEDATFAASLRHGSYAWHPSVRSRGRRDVLYGTAFAQRVIWEHQHPADCAGVRFLVLLHWVSGIGSLLHFLARALALAMHMGRVLAVFPEHPDPSVGKLGMPWQDQKFCPGKISWECWFLPLTKCALQPGADIQPIRMEHLGRFRSGNFTRHYVPEVFQELVGECSRVKRSLQFHWWHAQAITYIMRFNPTARSLLDSLRAEVFRVRRPNASDLELPHVAASLPPGTIAMHVRHGDKYLETQILPFAKYLAAARRLVEGEQVPVLSEALADRSDRRFAFPASAFEGRRIFVSTENPGVIEEASRLAFSRGPDQDGPWEVYHTLERRTNVDVATMRKERGNGQATLESFLNLELALSADGWVCNLFSNWCQLIDELRMTVGGKASAPYIHVFREGYRVGENCKPFHRRCYIAW